MNSKLQVIPAIDLKRGRCVRLEQGDFSCETTYEVPPVDIAKQWEALGAPMIHIVDLDGAQKGKSENLAVVAKICQEVSCPCELGGGIRSAENIERILDLGISRVVLGTILTKPFSLAKDILRQFGSETIVAGIDARGSHLATHGWQKKSSQLLVDAAKDLFDIGMRCFIYTDITRDGMFTGPNTEELTMLCDLLPQATFIASGGVGKIDHIRQLCELGKNNLQGIIVGKALYDGKVTYEALTSSISNNESGRKSDSSR